MKLEDFLRYRIEELRVFFPARFGRRWHPHVARGLGLKYVPKWLLPYGHYPRVCPLDRRLFQKVEDFAVSVGFRTTTPFSNLPLERKKFRRWQSLVNHLRFVAWASISARCLNASFSFFALQHKIHPKILRSDAVPSELYTWESPGERTKSPCIRVRSAESASGSVIEHLDRQIVPANTPGRQLLPPGETEPPVTPLNGPGAEQSPPRFDFDRAPADSQVRLNDMQIPERGKASGRAYRYLRVVQVLLKKIEVDNQVSLDLRMHVLAIAQRYAEGALARKELEEKLADGVDPTQS